MSYVFILEDLAGVERSELPAASNRRFSRAVGTLDTSSATVRLEHRDADFLLEGDALLRIEEVNDDFLVDGDKTLLGHHRLVSAEEVVSEDRASVAASFASPFWVLMRRLCGKSTAGYTKGTALAPVDRGDVIIRELVALANADSVTGVRMGTVTPSSSTYVSGWFYKPIGEAIAELAATLDGPDWRVRPIPYTGGYIGELDVMAAIGTYQPDAVFEYGDGLLNVRGYRRGVSLEATTTRAFHLPPGFPDSAGQVPMQEDGLASQAARGVLETVVTADLATDDLRRKLLQGYIAIRSSPRQVITFDPRRTVGVGVPRLGTDFDVGDIVPFRASALTTLDPGAPPELVKRIDVTTRVYSAEVDVDANTLSLVTAPT